MARTPTILRRGQSRVATLHSLPPEMLDKMRERVRTFAGFMLAIAALSAIVNAAVWMLAPLRDHGVITAIQLMNVVVFGALYTVAVRREYSTRTVMNMALVVFVLFSFVISSAIPYFTYLQYEFVPRMTWAIGLIILFPLIVPTPPLRTIVTVLAATATVPIAIWVLDTTTFIPITTDVYAANTWNALFAAILAFLASRVIYGMNVEHARAIEMGRYRLASLIGRGGMGEVWRAEHQLLARPAAIKLIRTGDENARQSNIMLERFEREAQSTAMLRSPHTIELYDFGRADDGTFYCVMEFLDGLDLETFVDEYGPVRPERAVSWLIQICHSLHEAHRNGLIHRDVKPANVFVCRYGEEPDFIKVLDFGLVKRINRGDPRLTQEGAASGTPAFMAPEMATGGASDITHLVDIYALGCLAWWLLTGELVFDADTSMKMLIKHAKDEPPKLSSRTELEIPSRLEELVHQCLEKEPADRPQSIAVMRQMLREIRDTMKNQWDDQRAAVWWDRYRPQTAAAERSLAA